MTISLSDIKEPVKNEMRDFLPYFKSTMHTKVSFLNLILKYIHRKNGKQIRPLIVFLSSKMFGKPSSRTFIGASLIELLHTATLIHDDVVDNSYLRRNLFSINALWKSKISVLTGDYLLAKGLELATEHQEYGMLQTVSEAVQEMSEGELIQTKKMRKKMTSPEDYLTIINKKTATLISASVIVGAKSGDAEEKYLSGLKRFGEYAGIVFQIKDDLLDYEISNITGKPKGSDIKENKLNLPLIYAIENAASAERKRILNLLHNSVRSKYAIKEISQFVKNYGGIEAATETMKNYKEAAIQSLSECPDGEAKESLKNLMEYFVSRKK